LACSPALPGSVVGACVYSKRKSGELNIVEKASENTIGRTPKNVLKPHRNRQWVIPPEANLSLFSAASYSSTSLRDRTPWRQAEKRPSRLVADRTADPTETGAQQSSIKALGDSIAVGNNAGRPPHYVSRRTTSLLLGSPTAELGKSSGRPRAGPWRAR
jgi:hypothetical protein